MCQDIKCPTFVTYIIGVPSFHAAVVNGLVLAGVVSLLHGHGASIV
jgi:hypothetical protein